MSQGARRRAPASPARPAIASRRGATRFGVRWLLLAVLVAIWQLAAVRAGNAYFPPPATIAVRAWRSWLTGPPSHLFLSGDAIANVLPSVGRMLAGWSAAVLLGVGLGLPLGRSGRALDYVQPTLRLARATPPATLVPVFIAIFHLGARMEIATIAFGACWPILTNAIDGARSIDAVQVETAQVYRLSPARRVRLLILPATLPKVFAGMRVSLALALILMVLSELVGGADGIGYLMNNAQTSYDLPGLWAGIALVGALGYGFNAALLMVERRLLGWRDGAAG